MNSRVRLTEFENPSPECKLVQPLWKPVRRFLKKPKLELPLEKAMAPHSSTLAWKIPWMEELVGCSPWGR